MLRSTTQSQISTNHSAPTTNHLPTPFTPVSDALARELGLITAAVYGVVWRYCQMPHGLCYASVERIARHLGLEVKTARRHLKKLCQLGYLEDTTPDRKHRPHVYRDTGQAHPIGPLPPATDPAPPETATPTHPIRPSEQSAVHPPSAAPDGSPPQAHPSPPKSHPSPIKSDPGLPHSPTRKQRHETKPRNHHEKDPATLVAADANAAAGAAHPAIKTFRAHTHRYPAKSWFQDVADTVGTRPADLQFWGQVVKDWVGCGYNPTNVKGMLDCYRQRALPGSDPRRPGNRPGSRLDRTIEAGLRLLEQTQ